ncbi:AMP-binding protein [soil metagenome]
MVITSPHPPVAVPDVPLTPFVLSGASELGDKPAVIDGATGRTLSFQVLVRAVDAVAAGLAGRGFRSGQVFAIFCPNLPELAVAFHAVATLGGIVTTVNPTFKVEELRRQLADSRARFLLTTPEGLAAAAQAAAGTGIEEIFVVGHADGATPFDRLSEGGGAVPTAVLDPHESIAVLPYSSGTTGWPKGVMLTHHNLVANILQVEAVHHLAPADTVIGVLPFFHIYGMTVIMNHAIHRGATIVTLARFDLEQFLTVMEQQRVTRAHLVPPIVLALAKHPAVDRFDLSSLRTIMSGAAPLGPELARACAERLDCEVTQGYGLTETSPVTHLTPDAGPNKPGSIGPPLPNTSCRVVDPATNKDVASGETGEIWVRGPQVMKGYLDDPEATTATVDADGWLRSGDIGRADEEGYFYVVDRLKELIKYKGFQVAPAELEALLVAHPALADAAVIPLSDEAAGEVPKAFVVATSDVTAEAVMDFVAARVAPHKRIRAVEFVDAIPRSPSGKILRRILVDAQRTRRAGA